MNEQSSSPKSEGQETGETGVGKTLRETRQAANIDVNKICTDLRIAPQTLEALERGNYHLLPGDPYIRALLGSLGRYLNLDPLALIQIYNKEIGAAPVAASIAPYKDKAQTYSTSHKQIFIGIFLALFVILFLLIGKLNKGEGDAASSLPGPANPLATDSLAPAQDTSLESKFLAPDSTAPRTAADSAQLLRPAAPGSVPTADGVRPDSAKAAPGAATVPSKPAATLLPPTAADSAALTSAVVKPLIDSVGVKVMRYGKEDFSTILRLGKQMQVSHTDTISVFVSKRRSVEVTYGGKTVIPDRKRFKIIGNSLIPF